MKFRIISDLHIDINHKIPLEYDDDVFTVVCGDISGYAEDSIQWIAQNVRNGVFVSGNHIAYSGQYTIEESQRELERVFPLDEPVSYLNDSYKIVDDVVFVGGTLWTDFLLGYGVNHREGGISKYRLGAKLMAALCMNDYRQKLSAEKFLTPDDTEFMHYHTAECIVDVCEKFPDKKIVVVTHHAPSNQSLDSRYVDNALNPCYASDMDNFILHNPNIKLWCHGHIHQSKDYKIGGTRVICNPRGYEAMGEINPTWNRDLIIEV